MKRKTKGQAMILGVVLLVFLVLGAAALIDIYHAEEAYNWGNRVAQQAAMAGISKGRNWDLVLATPDHRTPTPDVSKGECQNAPLMDLKLDDAYNAAESRLIQEMGLRHITGYTYDIRVITSALGGGIVGFPPKPRRLGESLSTWVTTRPAVGVYLTFSADTFLLSFIGIGQFPIEVFAAAEVVQPPQCTPQAP